MPTSSEILATGPARVREIYRDFGKFCQQRGRVSETDTRANILDRLLHEVLLWPREAIHRETYAHPGFVDYELRLGRPVVIVEAKATDVAFSIPYQKHPGARRLRLSGSLRTNKELLSAVTQVQRY